jgi:hypothetical protein
LRVSSGVLARYFLARAVNEIAGMSVLCGIDFSESSAKAAEVAVEIAAPLKLPLYLVHAVADWPAELYGDESAGYKF